MKIVCHCLVKNEENFVWYAINSVLDFVDEMLVCDQGSVDNTIQIIKSINSPKIKFSQSSGSVSSIRNQMLSQSDADWIFIHDGDEIWYRESIKKQIEIIKTASKNVDVVVNPNIMLIGDVYHYLEPKAGKYRIHDRVGHYNIRFVKNMPGLRVEGTYPNEAYVTSSGIKVQNLPKDKLLFSDISYIHASFVSRSSQGDRKTKYEIGEQFPNDYFYPEILFETPPLKLNCPWIPMDNAYKLKSYVSTPIKKLKRRII